MTIIEARNLNRGDHIYHNHERYTRRGKATNTPIAVKVNGAPRTWKRDPSRIEIPVKYGLYEYFYIRASDLSQWSLTPEEAMSAR